MFLHSCNSRSPCRQLCDGNRKSFNGPGMMREHHVHVQVLGVRNVLRKRGHYLIALYSIIALLTGNHLLHTRCSGAPKSAGVEQLRVDFTRTLYPPSSPPEIVKGRIYFTPDNALYLEVTSPVSQLITQVGKQMSIYYPEERKAFVIESANPLMLPFASAFLGSLRESMGLAELGFTTTSLNRRFDTIISEWSPPLVAKTAVSRVVLFELAGDVVQSESYDAKGLLSTRAVFKNHSTIKQGRVPMQIYGGWQSSRGWTRENLEFSNPETIQALPDHLNDFKIPSDVVPRRVQW